MIIDHNDVPPGTKVYLNGDEIADVISVDLIRRTVTTLVRDKHNQPKVDGSGEAFVQVTHRGQITIELGGIDGL